MHKYSNSELNAISKIIRILNRASTTEDLADALTRICATLHSQSGGMVLMQADRRGPGKAVLHNVNECFYRRYQTTYYAQDDIFPRAIARGLRIWRPTDVVTQKEWETSDVYTGFLRPEGIFHTLITAFGSALAPVGQMFLTRVKQDEPFSDGDMRLIEVIYPHLESAFREITLSMVTDTIGAALMRGADTMSRPVLIFSEDCTPLYINAKGRSMSAAAGMTEDALISEVCTSLKAWGSFGPPGCVDSSDAFCVLAGHTHALMSFVVAGSEAVYRVTMLVNGMIFLSLALKQTSVRHGLTKRESEVCAMLVRGLANKEIAESLFVSELTAKDHVKSVMAKLNVKSRSQVAPLVLGLPQ